MNKGFTLIEITVAVLLLAVLTVFIVPRVNNIISNNKEKVCASIEESALDASKSYLYKYTNAVDNKISSDGYFEVTLEVLIKEGLLDIDLENPYTNEQISVSNVVRITKNGNIYEYTYMGDDCK